MTTKTRTIWRKEDIQRKIDRALECLTKSDAYLIKAGANERSITHMLATYLADEFPELHVDCEYNRMWRDGDEMKKKVVLPVGMSHNISVFDTEASTVFPDIIVHRRENSDRNLLVVEAKKSSNSDRQLDFKKLDGFMAEKNEGGREYDFSAFIIFDVENPEKSSAEVKEVGENWSHEN